MVEPVTTSNEFLQELRRLHERQLGEYLDQILGSRERACQLSQEAFAALHRDSPLETWPFPRAVLFNLGTNLALMELRRRTGNRKPPHVTDILREESGNPFTAPERRAAAESLGEALAQAIKALRPTLRSVFVMAHLQGKRRSEIAVALDISEKRVDKRMTKALRLCRERLMARGIDLPSALRLGGH